MKKHLYSKLITLLSTLITLSFISQAIIAAELPSQTKTEKTLVISAYKAYKQRSYLKALHLFKKAAPHDATGLSDALIAHIYQIGLPSDKEQRAAIYWDQKALDKVKYLPIRAWVMNSLGCAYGQLHNRVIAFNYYQQAAIMGSTYAQRNLGVDYALGRGTIQDYTKAYAWISVAAASGLNDKHYQADIDQLRNALATQLNQQDHLYYQADVGPSLQQAQLLAKKYYRLYVLRELPSTKPHKSLSDKINASIKAFEK